MIGEEGDANEAIERSSIFNKLVFDAKYGDSSF